MDPDLIASERLVERIVMSLAAQVAAAGRVGMAPEALDALRDLDRHETRTFFGVAGHLVHYDGCSDVAALAQLVADAQRTGSRGRHGRLPGDRVRLVGEIPTHLAGINEEWLRQAEFTIRYVGDDETVDVQPDFEEDYLIQTLPTTLLQPVPKNSAS